MSQIVKCSYAECNSVTNIKNFLIVSEATRKVINNISYCHDHFLLVSSDAILSRIGIRIVLSDTKKV